MTSDDKGWSWRFTSTSKDDFAGLDSDDQQQIVTKLDDICDSPWREPPDYGEPLQNSPYRKIRIGEFRLSVTFDRNSRAMIIARIKRRGGAYTADD